MWNTTQYSDGEHRVFVRSYDTDVDADYSSVVLRNVTVKNSQGNDTPQEPRFVRLTTLPDGTTLRLNRTEPKSGAESYEIYETNSTMWDGSFAFEFNTTLDTTSNLYYDIPNRANQSVNDQHYYCVKAVKGGKKSKCSIVVGSFTKQFRTNYDSWSQPIAFHGNTDKSQNNKTAD